MDLPEELLIQSLSEKKVIYFSSDRLNTDEPHYHVLIKKTDENVIFLSCCTSQFEKRSRFIQSRELPMETLVWINSKTHEFFTKDTYVDCNSLFEYELDELLEMLKRKQLSLKGDVSEDVYNQIVNGLYKSPLIAEEIKEKLPPNELG